MLRDNFDRLRNESRNERNRDARNYYMNDSDDYSQGQRREYDDRREDYNRPQNWGSARSDYGDRAYGGRLNQQGDSERGFFEKAGDEVSSWFGDEDAERRRDRDARMNQSRDRNQNYSREEETHQHFSGSYNPTEASPFHPLTNRIYDDGRRENQQRGLMGRDRQRQNYGNQSVQSLRARDVMSSNVTTVHPNDTVQQAARMMRDGDLGAVPVVDRSGRMIGMVTDRDITVRIVASGTDFRNAQVQDCMTDEVFACHENDSLQQCINEMTRHQIRRIAVVDNQNRVMGIISQGDLARHAQNNRQQHDDFTNMVGEISEPGQGAYR